MILLPLPGGAGAAERERLRDEARKILDNIRQGESFEKMAYHFSKGPSPEQGGTSVS
jgi:hypothetical protein